ncbi:MULTISPECIES: hypothetical protein [Bacilli]|uniref:hypothetical protein n=1 Tax=Bacilli TaxID=91061 RepID=UPI0025559A9A|nr:hypothetical protein [Streptococcus agalactiae]MDK8746870.1 hypothetical protein [Streptococcus agalactiae]
MAKRKRACLFCGNTENLTSEHVFPQWLLDGMGIRKKKMDLSHLTLLGNSISERPLTPNTLINGLVCRKCNNEWLSRMEDEIKPYLLPLIKGVPQYPLEEYHKELSLWAFKTAIILNNASNYRNIVPRRHFRYLYKHRRIPENVCVLFGITENIVDLNWVQSQGVMHSGINNSISEDTRFHDIYKITIQLGPILIKVIYSPFYEYKYVLDKPSHMMLHPYLAGTGKDFVAAEDLMSFDIEGSMFSR